MAHLTLQGAVWDGRTATPGRVELDEDGTVLAIGPEDPLALGAVVRGAWIGPALVDAHVHLSFHGPLETLAGGVGAMRDLGAPLGAALGWRDAGGGPVVAVAGELITAPGGYPVTSWGSAGFTRPVSGPRSAAEAVGALAASGVDVIKVVLEPGERLPVFDLPTTRAVVTAAHASGLGVTAHALTAAMVARALDAGVDELAHTPTEPLPPALVDRIARARVTVASTLHALGRAGFTAGVMHNAAAFVRAGVRLVYGTDLGNVGPPAGVCSAELEALAASGLGADGALHAATVLAAQVAGLAGRVETAVRPGTRPVLAVLDADPLVRPSAWDQPLAVVADGRVVGGSTVRTSP